MGCYERERFAMAPFWFHVEHGANSSDDRPRPESLFKEGDGRPFPSEHADKLMRLDSGKDVPYTRSSATATYPRDTRTLLHTAYDI